ncbi:MAG: radical SAM protein [Candidatus Bathyarchaeia archaeon]|nr:radical SAM protein [Candidatus Bathyarchaeia archaeon]
MKKSEWIQLIDDCIEAGVFNIIFSGGDPIAFDALPELIEYSAPKFFIGLLTDGFRLTRRVSQSLASAGLKEITLYLNGADAVTHDRIMGRNGSFTHVTQAVSLLKDVGIDVHITTHVLRSNIHQVNAILELAHHLGAVHFDFNFGLEFAWKGTLDAFMPSLDECKNLLLRITEKEKELDIKVEYPTLPASLLTSQVNNAKIL